MLYKINLLKIDIEMSISGNDIQYIYDLIDYRFKNVKTKVGDNYYSICDYYFPIEEVNGVKSACFIRFVKKDPDEKIIDANSDDAHDMYLFFIDNKNDAYAGDMAFIMYKNKNRSLMKLLEQIFDVFPKLRLTIEGEFSTEPEENRLINILSNIQNIKLNYEECCVCNNHTKTRTRCNHSLCYQCWTKLPMKFKDEDYYQECLICRGIMPYY